MGKKGPQQQGSQAVQLDPQTRAYTEYMRQAAKQQYGDLMGGGELFPGATAEQMGAVGQLGDAWGRSNVYGDMAAQIARTGMAGAGQVGMGGVEGYMNPYQQQVMDAMQSQFARQRAEAQQTGQQQATLSGAYGGSRGAILEGQLMGDVNRQEAMQMGQMLQGGYTQAAQQMLSERQRQMQMANLGMGSLGSAAGQQAGMAGQLYGMGSDLQQIQQRQQQEALYRAQAGLGMLQGSVGPYGSTTSQTGPGGSVLGGAAGGAMAGSAFGPWGAAIGGGIGLLGGLFG